MRYFGRHHNSGLFRKALASESLNHPLHQQLPGARVRRKTTCPAFCFCVCDWRLSLRSKGTSRAIRSLLVRSSFLVCRVFAFWPLTGRFTSVWCRRGWFQIIAACDHRSNHPRPASFIFADGGHQPEGPTRGGSSPSRPHGGCSRIRYWRASPRIPDSGDSLRSTSSGAYGFGISRRRTSSLQL